MEPFERFWITPLQVVHPEQKWLRCGQHRVGKGFKKALSLPVFADRFRAGEGHGPSPRVSLKRMSRGTRRGHLSRSGGRVLTLVAADALAYGAARELVRAIRDYALLGTGTAGVLGKFIPQGSLGGWEYVVALLGGLDVTANYGRGDSRRASAGLPSMTTANSSPPTRAATSCARVAGHYHGQQVRGYRAWSAVAEPTTSARP